MSRWRKPSYLALVWALCATLGCGGAAFAGVRLFPELGFAMNPTGEFRSGMILYAALVGFGLGIGQAAAWLWARALSLSQLLAWISATTIAVVVIILPLWWIDAEVFFIAPYYVVVPLGPGLVALGLTQAVILRSNSVSPGWFGATVIGGALGGIGGLFAAIMFGEDMPFEAIWAAGVALGMAGLQQKHLKKIVNFAQS